MKESLPKNASKHRVDLVIDRLREGSVEVDSGQSPGGIDTIFEANSFQGLVKTLVSSASLDN